MFLLFVLVIVESTKDTPALNDDSVLFNKDRVSVGRVRSLPITLICFYVFFCFFSFWMSWPAVRRILSFVWLLIIKLQIKQNLLICFIFFLLGVWSLWSCVSAILYPEIQLPGRNRAAGPQNKRDGLLCPQNQRLHWVHLCRQDQAVSNSFYRAHCLGTNWSLVDFYFLSIFSDSFLIFMTAEIKDLMLLGKMTTSLHQR